LSEVASILAYGVSLRIAVVLSEVARQFWCMIYRSA
jgi:hypothetical protein